MANHSSDPSPSVSPSSSSNAPKYGTRVPNRIFVGGISSSTTESELHALFSNYGNVRATKIISDRAGVSKGYGFVTFETEDEAARVQHEADNIMLKDRKLNIAPAIRKQQPFSTYSRSNCDTSVAAANSNPILYHNGVPYTYNNGMAYFAPSDATTYQQYGVQPQAAYSMVYPTVYIQPQNTQQQYQYQMQSTTSQQPWIGNEWRWPAPLGYGQTPSPVVNPQYLYTSSIPTTGEQTAGPANQYSVPTLHGNPHVLYNVSTAGGAGDVEVQTVDSNLTEYSAKHQNGKEPEQQRKGNSGHNVNAPGDNANTSVVLLAPMSISAMTGNGATGSAASSDTYRPPDRRTGGHYKRNNDHDQCRGPGPRNTRKANDRSGNGNALAASSSSTSVVQSNLLHTPNLQRVYPTALPYSYQYHAQSPQVFQQYQYIPHYQHCPPPQPYRFRGQLGPQVRQPVPRMYWGGGDNSGDGGPHVALSGTPHNGQGPLTPPNTPMSPGIAATDPAIIGSMCAMQTLSLN